MVTWWKKYRYSVVIKLLSLIACCFGVALLAINYIGFVNFPREDSYYEKQRFQVDITETAGYVRDWIVRYIDKDIFNPDKLTTEELEAYNGEKDPKEGIIQDRKAYYEQLQAVLKEKSADFDYLGVNHATGDIVTNISYEGRADIEQIKSNLLAREAYLIGNGTQIYKTSGQFDLQWLTHNYYRGDSFEGDLNYEIIVAIAEKDRTGSTHWWQKHDFNEAKRSLSELIESSLIGIILLLLGGSYLIYAVGRRGDTRQIKLQLIDRIPFEFQAISYLLFMKISISTFLDIPFKWKMEGWIPYVNMKGEMRTWTSMVELLAIVTLGITVLFIGSIIRHYKNKSMYSYSLSLRSVKWIFYNLINEKTLPLLSVLSLGAYVVINMALTTLTLKRVYFMISLLLFNIVVIMGVLKLVIDYNKLTRGIKEIEEGDLEAKVHLNRSLPMMVKTANRINNIGAGLEKAVEQTLRSERLKTELITNVSHDLKTPLTSIISYVDLLKAESIENEIAEGYIQVLDERSQRLKQLIEDLLEASKAATGNLKVDLQCIELNQLILQEIGENADLLKEKRLEIIYKEQEAINILADGRHMWRILENLFSNISKYALEGTRVYIDVFKNDHYGTIVIKNISRDPLATDSNELTERFVRGDEARTSEGSGLGLAIAKSLVALQKGSMKIDIDGDLFKVEINIPLIS